MEIPMNGFELSLLPGAGMLRVSRLATMSRTMGTPVCLAAVASATPMLPAQDLAWQAEAGARSAALTVPANGKAGFALLTPEQTDIRFTHTLSELEGVSNRVLLQRLGRGGGGLR